MTSPHDDEYGGILRRALHAEADEIMPSAEGLERIRARTRNPAAHRMWWQLPWVRPAMALGGAMVLAAAVMAGTPGLRHTVLAAFGPSPNTPTGHSTPYTPATNTSGYSTNPVTATPTPTGSGGPSQGPGGGPCGQPSSGTVSPAVQTPSATGSPDSPDSPGSCDTGTPTTPPSSSTPTPTSSTLPTTPPEHSSTPSPSSESPTADPQPSNSHPDPQSSP